MEASNVKAMREALEKVRRVLHCAIVAGILKGDDVNSAFNEVIAALSAPPRNCDVGTAEDQADRFDKFCYSHSKCHQCPVQSIWNSTHRKKRLREIIRCEIIWAQMPYKEERLRESTTKTKKAR